MRCIEDPESFRTNIRSQLQKIVKDEKITRNVEKGLLNYSITVAKEKNIVRKWENNYFVILYIERLRTIMHNLKHNKELKKILLSGEIKPHKIAFMTHQDMNPKRWETLINNKKIRDNNMYNPQMDANTDNFTCRRCKSNRCSYYQLQTRSADEPMTTFVTCIDCGNRWKC